jgi:hypothetical protein
VDGSFVEANAAKQSRIPREQLAEAAQVKQTLRQLCLAKTLRVRRINDLEARLGPPFSFDSLMFERLRHLLG